MEPEMRTVVPEAATVCSARAEVDAQTASSIWLEGAVAVCSEVVAEAQRQVDPSRTAFAGAGGGGSGLCPQPCLLAESGVRRGNGEIVLIFATTVSAAPVPIVLQPVFVG
jgi:hypothetical protein